MNQLLKNKRYINIIGTLNNKINASHNNIFK